MKKILALFLIFLVVVNLACQVKTKPNMQARRDSIRVDSLSRLPAVLFNTALALEKKQAGKAKEFYTKLAKDSTFWGEQARLRLEFLSVKNVKEYIAKGILGTWKGDLIKSPWSRELYRFGAVEFIKIHPNGISEWIKNGALIKTTTYRLYDGVLAEVPSKGGAVGFFGNMDNIDFQCIIEFNQGDYYILRKKQDKISLCPFYCQDCPEIFYWRVK